ncbi:MULTISPECIES: hybrid-cluster NAD(P)-dependent oxidoreductase [unclassified Brevibacterium]|uniref:hybrid-cluster NAD(P)-dependent oxidoreductase n=1 Tax=unclassified Brevibacterium TaxID=2614124 RepID=UPI0020171F3D|nr:hybrid-cluster NAD(P)-dependent oxidoreductase [Brevibacterium sp. 2SA]MCM1010942.1 hybrid-cluster NAD(P)-dependent oxidoreductase [Brevibacterium sp. XM4083]
MSTAESTAPGAAAAAPGAVATAPGAAAAAIGAVATATMAGEADGITGLAECVGITRVTHDIITIELRAPWLTSADFEPGQYLTVRVPELGLERCYSISSAPFGTNTFTLTVKRVPGGAVSTHLHDVLRIGDRLHVDGPYGLFSTSFHPADKHLFVSAGSGTTPIMSMIRALLAHRMPDPVDIVLIHSASTPKDIVFRAELDQLATVPGVRVVVHCSRDAAAERWTGPRGRIGREILAEAAPDACDRETFVCGPVGYMDAVRPLLAEVGARRVHEESFVFGSAPTARLARRRAEQSVVPVAPGATFAIDFASSGTRVECDVATTVLEATAAAGLPVPSSCGAGMCGTCKSTLLSGEVDMRHAGGIRPKEIAAGRFLPCCSTPLSDLVIER